MSACALVSHALPDHRPIILARVPDFGVRFGLPGYASNYQSMKLPDCGLDRQFEPGRRGSGKSREWACENRNESVARILW